MKDYVLLVAGWITYFFLHSALASGKIKRRFPARPFRVFYILFSIAGLLALLFLNGSIQSPLFFAREGAVRTISLILTVFGVMIIQSCFRQYSLKGFMGLTEEQGELKTAGILNHVRHPIYSGTVLIALGLFFFIPNLPTLISCCCTLLYLPIGIYLEEKKLLLAFGEAYQQYKKKVAALIPGLL